MDNFIFAVNAVLPLFILTAVGWCLTRFKIWNSSFLKTANNLSFHFFIPVMCFYNIYTSDFSAVFDGNLLIFFISVILTVCLLAFLTVPILVKNRPRRGVIIQALFRGNFALVGVSLCESLAGEAGAQLASVFLAFIIPLFNVLATIVLSVYSNSEPEPPTAVIKQIIKNPLIIGCALGIAFSVLKIPLPKVILKPISDIKSVSTPFALMVLGGDFNFRSFASNILCVLSTSLVRLLVIPAIAIFIASRLGYTGVPIAVLIAMFGTPVAVSSTAMTYKMNGDYPLSCEMVVFTTLFSAFSLTLLTYAAKALSLF